MLISIRAAVLSVIIFAPMSDPYLGLLTAANTHAKAHGAPTPTLSPVDATVLGPNAPVNVAELHKAGFKVLPWTTNDPEKIRALINLRVDGIISDYPDRLQKVLAEEKSAHPAEAALLRHLRRLRPSRRPRSPPRKHSPLLRKRPRPSRPPNSKPTPASPPTTSRSSGTISSSTPSPAAAPTANLTPSTNRVYIRDISLAEAQSTYICDKLHHGPEYGNARFDEQQNDLALSPVAVAFAKHEHLISPYVPTHAEQLFHFVAFYADYYTNGPGKSHPDAAARAANARTVRFNLETKITPFPNDPAGPPTRTPRAPPNPPPTTPSTPRPSSPPSAEPSPAITWSPAPKSRASTSAPSSSSKSSSPKSPPTTSPEPPRA